MAFKTFAPGVLTSSDVNTFLMRQAVITCTSSTRPASPSEGMTIYETDTNLYRTYDGSNWDQLADHIAGAYTTFTPTWTNLTVGNAPTNIGQYQLLGNTVVLVVRLVFGSTTSISGDVILDEPAGLAASGATSIAQSGIIRLRDDSLGTGYVGTTKILSSGINLNSIAASLTYAQDDAVNATTPFTWTTDDEIRLQMVYQVA